MNQAHLHLLFNHFPIIVPIIGIIILVCGFIFRSESVKRTSYFIFMIGALLTLPAFFTGEGAEQIVKKAPDYNGKGFIHAHEEIAETFAVLSYVLGAMALLALWANWKLKSYAKILTYVAGIFSLVVIFFGLQTGNTGGEIRHSEIRKDYKIAPQQQQNGQEDHNHNED